MQSELESMFMKHYAPNRCEPSIEVIMKMAVQRGWRRVLGVGCQGGCECERGIDVVKIQKKKNRGRGSGQGGCERRIKVFVKCQKNGGGGGRVVGSQGGCE